MEKPALLRLLSQLLLSACCFLAGQALAQHSDYAREQRLAQEWSAQLLVGELRMLPHAPSTAGLPPLLPPLLPSFAAIYAPGQTAKPAIVLAHGVGTHPDDGLTGQLRQHLHDLGYTTLAPQMPIAARQAQLEDYFPKLFPEASARLHSAALWLRGQGHERVVLLGHSMGAWMSNVYLDELSKRHSGSAKDWPYAAWVSISLTGGYTWATRSNPLPILDLYAEQDIPMAASSAWRRSGVLKLAAPGSQQIKISGADAQWRGAEKAAAQAIDAFLRQALP